MSTTVLLYCRPDGAADGFGVRVHACAARHHLEVRELAPAALARRGRARAFVSPTQPTVVIVRDGVVVAQVIGAVSAHELLAVIARAI